MKKLLIIIILFFSNFLPVHARVEDRSLELYNAASTNNIKLLMDILQAPFYNTNVPMGDADMTPLMVACSKGYTEAAQILLKHEADPDAVSKSGDTALMFASYEDCMGCVKILLEKRAKINLKNKFGDTALHKAVSRGNFDIARLLIEKGIDINAKNNYGVSPLMNAASSNIDFINYLIKKGADLTAVDNSGNSVLDYVKSPNEIEIRKYIIGIALEKKLKMPVSLIELVFRDNEGTEFLASSYLPDKKNPRMYAPENLFDGDISTVWAVGNGGIGEKIWFPIHENISNISFVNGCAKNKMLFGANNRIKKALVSVWLVFFLEGDVSEIASIKRAITLSSQYAIMLKDSIEAQNVMLPYNWKEIHKEIADAKNNFKSRPAFKERKILSEELYMNFEIAEIYKGSKYNDTCLSEIVFSDVQISEKSILGNWKALKGSDSEEISFLLENGIRRFTSYLHERPFEMGSWELKNNKLYIYVNNERSDTKKIEYSATLNKRKLTLKKADGSSVELYERK